jgi:hypothetical protein
MRPSNHPAGGGDRRTTLQGNGPDVYEPLARR